jgi:3-hydroxymyristoyl/3-hydroxydecanoyl-(acyl carrier protein) dehydratase
VVVVPAAGAAESFPFPVPLTMLTEAMAQAILLTDPPEQNEGLRLVAIDLRQEVNAGDRLSVVCRKEASFGKLRRYACRALRGGSLVAEVTVTVGF